MTRTLRFFTDPRPRLMAIATAAAPGGVVEDPAPTRAEDRSGVVARP